jgi:hypothetical protein
MDSSEDSAQEDYDGEKNSTGMSARKESFSKTPTSSENGGG